MQRECKMTKTDWKWGYIKLLSEAFGLKAARRKTWNNDLGADSVQMVMIFWTIVAKIVLKRVSYLHTPVLFMYFYYFTVRICLQMYVFISNIFWYEAERYETLFLHWNKQLSTWQPLTLPHVSMYKTKVGFNLFCFSVRSIWGECVAPEYLLI